VRSFRFQICIEELTLFSLAKDDQPPLSRPYYAIYLSHLRALQDQSEAILVSPVRYGAFFVVESLAEVAQGRLSLCVLIHPPFLSLD
jgi:hypothetical protein